MKEVLNYIDGQMPSGAYTKQLADAVQEVKDSEQWRRDYMLLMERDMENFQEGHTLGQIRAFIRAGWTIKQIAEELDISEEYVQHILDEYSQEEDE